MENKVVAIRFVLAPRLRDTSTGPILKFSADPVLVSRSSRPPKFHPRTDPCQPLDTLARPRPVSERRRDIRITSTPMAQMVGRLVMRQMVAGSILWQSSFCSALNLSFFFFTSQAVQGAVVRWSGRDRLKAVGVVERWGAVGGNGAVRRGGAREFFIARGGAQVLSQMHF